MLLEVANSHSSFYVNLQLKRQERKSLSARMMVLNVWQPEASNWQKTCVSVLNGCDVFVYDLKHYIQGQQWLCYSMIIKKLFITQNIL